LVALFILPFRLYGAWLSLRLAKRMMALGPQIPGINNSKGE